MLGKALKTVKNVKDVQNKNYSLRSLLGVLEKRGCRKMYTDII